MITVKEIESVIKKLSKEELAAFRKWFEEFDAMAWDKQFEEDVNLGKLDKFSEQAIADYKSGKCRKI